ncbi:MAG: hypothetical protein JST00_26085 [Deltaproteobacteria bacterium]|nr:hypothetical protein [Deltaproteobacteria bacterium]
MSSCRSIAASFAAVLALLDVTSAHAQGRDTTTWGDAGTVTRARAAYDRGKRAHAAGDHAAAARAFAEADALVPEPASLEAALESAMRADDAALGAELLERGENRTVDEGLRKTMATAKVRFAGRTGVVKADCASQSPCLVSVDGVASDGTRPVHVKVGPHAVVVQRGGERVERLVEVAAGATVVVPPQAQGAAPPTSQAPSQVAAPPAAPPAIEISPPGLSPVWFVVAVGATSVAGGFALINGLDALSKHDRFEQGNCGPGSIGRRATDCDAIADDGKAAQVRTNVGIALGAALAVATTALGIWAIRWRDGSSARVGAALGPGRAGATFELTTP